MLNTVEAAFNRLDQPMPLGYSSAGVIVELGQDIENFKVGQRVACAGGGFAVHAEYAVVPRNLMVLVPDGVADEAAAFATIGAIALHGFRLATPQLGERVAVIGLGLLGLLAVQVATAAGCQVLGVDLDRRRVELARQLGVEAVLRDQAEDAALSISHGRGFDVVLICADTPSPDPVELAGYLARDRAKVVAVGAVGLQIPRKVYYEKEISFINSRSYGPGRYDPLYEEGGQDYPLGYVRWTEGRNLEAFIELLRSRRVNITPLITHRYPIVEATTAYEMITGKLDQPYLGVVLTYPDFNLEDESADMLRVVGQRGSPPVTSPQLSCQLGVLGAGNYPNAVLFPAMKKIPDLNLVGIASASGLNAQSAANRFGFHYATSDETQIIQDPEINTVAILTRHHLHAQQVLASWKAGKHVFCEKPLAINQEELDEIFAALEMEDTTNQGNLPTNSPVSSPLLMVGFNRRFAPLATKLHSFVADCLEPLVVYYRVNAGYLPLTHWLHDPNQGGGRIIGEGCHFIDFLSYLVGDPPISVSTQGLPDGDRYREDNIIMTFSFPDGSLGTVSYLANGDKTFPKERVEVFSGGRIAILDDFRALELVQNGRRQVVRSRLRQDKGHQAEWSRFVQAILSGGPPLIPYEHLRGVAMASYAAVESLRCGENVKIHMNP
jgi:predicted dehydrogenase/threonine dehydrogenase-like Zn-dependent dehydrogenase